MVELRWFAVAGVAALSVAPAWVTNAWVTNVWVTYAQAQELPMQSIVAVR
jgi:antirestriction protein ArdC